MSTLRLPRERNEWSIGTDGVPWTTKRKDEVDRYTVDWTEHLNDGETINSQDWSDRGGVHSSGHTISGLETYANVTGTNGRIDVTITTSGGRTLIQPLVFLASADSRTVEDYPV